MSWLITPQQRVNWTPALIPTAIWLDASDASTVTLQNGLVSEWRDKSGNARNATQVTPSLRPSYNETGLNGQGCLVTAANTHLILSMPNALPFWFYLGEPYSQVASSASCVLSLGGGNPSFRLSAGSALYRDNSSTPVSFASSLTGVNSYTYRALGGSHLFSRNGAAEVSRAQSGSLANFSRFMGADAGDSDLKAKILIGMDAVPDVSTIAKIQGWAHWTSGLQSLLPNDHPHKNSPPVP